MSTPTFSHIGLCVTDIDRSVNFYVQGLGFELGQGYEIGAPFHIVMDLPDTLHLKSQFVQKDGVQLELLQYFAPETLGPAERRPMNQLGLTHLSVRVEAIEPVIERVVAHGGQVHRETYVDAGPGGEFVYCTDPDGIRVELMRLNG
ncbi:VOC family protein [Sphingomonas jatrophae]|uniref:Lactoylglutathione lyase n=1 Tax=Sphingomonas jatrophae TaxID=1166337 RepID=A0A1I6KJ11_9SPHN|nr:VOC family protein [Sphingomonas jatrophae]SFR91229.1 lactoylglutathione lyase [Sphingomonas jatrophae]